MKLILVEAEGETIVYARAATMSGVRSDEASKTVNRPDGAGNYGKRDTVRIPNRAFHHLTSHHGRIKRRIQRHHGTGWQGSDRNARYRAVNDCRSAPSHNGRRCDRERHRSRVSLRSRCESGSSGRYRYRREEKGWIDNHGITRSLLAKIADLQRRRREAKRLKMR